jgi:Ca2+-binding RTX toxin-like protein
MEIKSMRKDGTNGPDQLIGTNESDVLNGLGENDTIKSLAGEDTLFGGAGADRLWAGNGDDYVLAGVGNDVIYGEGGQDTAKGGDGNDTLRGGSADDSLYGDAGVDSLYGDAGNDWLDGGSVTDKLFGGVGNDTLVWRTGSLELRDQAPSGPLLDGGSGYDTLRIDNEVLWYVSDFEGGWIGPFEGRVGILVGDDGFSVKVGNATPEDPIGVRAELYGIERIEASGLGPIQLESRSEKPNNYTVVGTSHADSLAGGAGSQILYGKGGSDSIDGGDGDDRLVGGSGDDFISGGIGRDILDGGGGADTYYDYLPNMSGERISLFEGAGKSGGDRLNLLLPAPPENIKITEYVGYTTFDWLDDGSDAMLRVDAINMKLGEDYLFS